MAKKTYSPISAVTVWAQEGWVAMETHAGPPVGLNIGERAHHARNTKTKIIELVRMLHKMLHEGHSIQGPGIMVKSPLVANIRFPLR